jgi:hypothetical protein
MPWDFAFVIASASYSKPTKQITCVWDHAGAFQYAVSNIEVSPAGAGVWVSVASIDSWSDDAGSGTFLVGLAPGNYDVRGTSSDNTPYVLLGSLLVPCTGFYGKFW